MQGLKNKIVVTVIAIIVLITGIFGVGSMQSKNSYALPLDFKEFSKCDTLYYFSDSSPAFRDMAEGMAGYDYRVFFDVKSLITEQELAYLLYSGYFWGFEQSYRNVAIIEIKTMQPDSLLLENLFACFKAQGCRVMFISPYAGEYGSLSNCDTIMPCNKDKYSLYVKRSICSMSGANGYMRDNTLLLLDGRFAGIYYDLGNYDLSRLYYRTNTMRRILCYMNYGWDADESDFEKQLYENIWSIYMEYVMYDYGFDLNYFDGDTNIDDYIAMWTQIKENDPDFEERFRQVYLEEYLAKFNEYTDLYYSEIAKSLAKRNIHILMHADGDLHVDLFYKDDDGEYSVIGKEYHFKQDDVEIFLDTIAEWGIEYLYEMGIWYLKPELYYFIWNIQKALSEGASFLDINPAFIWEAMPIIWGDGPIVISDTMMREEAGEYDEYVQEELEYIFEEKLLELLFTK